jgi:protein phosphatase
MNPEAMKTDMEHLFVLCSDPGKVRKQNEDAAGHAVNKTIDAELFCVADGMGGYGSGDVASRTVVDAITREFMAVTSCELNTLPRMVAAFFAKSHDALRAAKISNNIPSIFGTTLAALVLFQGIAVCANVGDTRIYCFDGENLTQKTHDHTIVNDLLKKSLISMDEARVHPHKHVLTQALTGDEIPPEPFIQVDALNRDHLYLICSDGLYNMVDGDFIRSILKQSSIFQAKDALLKQAYTNGATDNITFQIIK